MSESCRGFYIFLLIPGNSSEGEDRRADREQSSACVVRAEAGNRAISFQIKIRGKSGSYNSLPSPCLQSMLGYELNRRVVVGTKQQILKAMEDLPDGAGVEDALDRLYLLYKVEKGLLQADRGELISQEDVRQRMAKWLK